MWDGAGGSVEDVSGNGNHGALKGGVIWSPSEKGDVLSFNGSTGYVDAGVSPTLQFTPTSAFTISAWFYARSTTGTVLQQGQSGSKFGYSIRLSGSTVLFDSTSGQTAALSSGIVTGKWLNVAITYNNSKLIGYLNGVVNNSQAFSATQASGFKCTLGAMWRFDGSIVFPFNGLIADARVLPFAANADQVLEMYNDQSTGFLRRLPFFMLGFGSAFFGQGIRTGGRM